MAVDTQDKRGNCVAFPIPAIVLPLADGSALNLGDRRHLTAAYRGVPTLGDRDTFNTSRIGRFNPGIGFMTGQAVSSTQRSAD